MLRAAPRFVLWLLVVSVLSAGAYFLLHPLYLIGHPDSPASEWLNDRIPLWIRVILTRVLSSVAIFSFLAAMTVALVGGPRALRARHTRRGTALTVCGLLLAAIYCGGPMLWYARARQSMEVLQAQTKASMTELRERLESGSIPESSRERTWRFYAEAMYRDEGVQVEIPGPDGRRIRFEPAESDLANRRFYLKLKEALRPPTGHLEGSALWVGLCLAVGLLTPLRWPGNPGRAPGPEGAKPGTGALAEE